MIRIGDFSKLSRVSVKSLRYYDEMELLKPVEVDRFTGYRYYEYHQLAHLNRILALKDLGFSLGEIGRLLDDGLSADQLRGMLQLRQAQIKQQVQEEVERLKRVEARLRQIEQEDEMSAYEVVIKDVEALKVASTRGVVPTPPDQGTLWRELGGYLAEQGVRQGGACLSLYHDDEYQERDWDIEACQPVEADVPESERVKARVLPAAKMACTIHNGPFASIGEAYNAIAKWLDENGYRVVGSPREVYLRMAEDGSQNDPDTVTEIQFPVEKG
jgi:effector-binding domain-containing protein